MREQNTGLFRALVDSTRPMSSGVAGLLSFATGWLRSGLSKSAFLAGAAMCLVTMFGFIVNDILDLDKDVRAGVQRPIACGRLSIRAAWLFATVVLAAACALAAALETGFAIILLTAVALVCYTPVARCIPVLKGFYVAGLCIAPLFYGAAISSVRIAFAAYAIDALFVFGREVLMDSDELAGDQLAGLRTIPALVGASWARRLGEILMVLALVSLNFVAQGNIGRTAAALSVSSLVCILIWPWARESRRIAFTRIPMFTAALALASS